MTETTEATELAKLKAKLARLADYGLDTRNIGDGDSNALWNRVDNYRAKPDATLSAEDIRALAEWWAKLHLKKIAAREA